MSNPSGLENRVRAGQVQYLDSNGVDQCALLPQQWQNGQEGRLASLDNRRRRLTPYWMMGDAPNYGDNLAYGTVLATFDRATGKYGNGDPQTGSHTVVFLRWKTDENGMRGMEVAQQLAEPSGSAKIGFIPFKSGNQYLENAYAFNVVRLGKPLRRFTMADKE